MIVDTSVWIDFLRGNAASLASAVDSRTLLVHPFVVGELACGSIRGRDAFLASLQLLPTAAVASHDDVFQLVSRRRLWGRGLSWIDAHLLCSALLSGTSIWTLDRALREACAELGVEHDPR